jgi:hypothetical protein
MTGRLLGLEIKMYMDCSLPHGVCFSEPYNCESPSSSHTHVGHVLHYLHNDSPDQAISAGHGFPSAVGMIPIQHPESVWSVFETV